MQTAKKPVAAMYEKIQSDALSLVANTSVFYSVQIMLRFSDDIGLLFVEIWYTLLLKNAISLFREIK